MNPGDILLFKASDEDLIAKLIAWGTESEYSHVAVCVSSGMALSIESMAWKGVRAIDIRKIKQQYDVYMVKEGNTYNLDGMVSFLVDKLGSGYDYLGVIWLGILKLFVKFGAVKKETTDRFQIARDYFCSELCYEAFYKGGGLDIVPQVDSSDVTSPGDIAKSPVIGKVL